eukprot:scaffold62071_cov31-Tisochrysis_lutea.AAC.2
MSPCSRASSISACVSSGGWKALSRKHTVTLTPTSGDRSQEFLAESLRFRPTGPWIDGTPNSSSARSFSNEESAEQRSGRRSPEVLSVEGSAGISFIIAAIFGRQPGRPRAIIADSASILEALASGSTVPCGERGGGSRAALTKLTPGNGDGVRPIGTDG